MNDPVLASRQTPIEIALDIDSAGHTTAKKLYAWLELRSGDYARWVKQNITENPYAEEGNEFSAFERKTSETGGRPTQDFILSAAFAKKLAMASRSERGEQAREYFIRVEAALASQQAWSRVGSREMQDRILIVEAAARMLNMNDASKILMLGRFCKQEGVPSDFLPSYEDNGGRQLIAASTLLKEFGLGMSAVKFNKLLLDAGYLEERERPSSKDGKTKKFKALTEKGLEYGENQISAQNPREVQPLYYKDTFKDLFDAVAGE